MEMKKDKSLLIHLEKGVKCDASFFRQRVCFFFTYFGCVYIYPYVTGHVRSYFSVYIYTYSLLF